MAGEAASPQIVLPSSLSKEDRMRAQAHSCLPSLQAAVAKSETSPCIWAKSQSSSIFQLSSLHPEGEPQDGCFNNISKGEHCLKCSHLLGKRPIHWSLIATRELVC